MIMLVKSFLTEIQIERQNSLLYSIKTAKSNDLHRAKIMHSPNSPPPYAAMPYSVTQKIANQIFCLPEERFGMKKWLARK